MSYRLWKVSPILLCNKLSPSKLFNMNIASNWEITRFPHPLIPPSSLISESK